MRKSKELICDQYIDGKWVYVGNTTKLKTGYIARRHQEFNLINEIILNDYGLDT
jgi:hypothetical protein